MESSPPTNMQPGPRSTEWGGLSRHLLSRVDELQEVLSKERQNYITLQQLTYRLQEANIQAKDEIRCLRSEKQALEDQMNRQTVAYEKSLLAKTEEAEEMRRQQEMLKAGLQQETNLPLREMCRQLEEEVEKYRSGYNRVRYECIGLQSQLEQQRGEHAHGLESQRLLYQAEMSLLQKDKEELVARLQGFLLRSDEKKLEALLKERLQLKVRLQGLEAEVAELHAQKENLSQQADDVAKRLTESQDLGNSLETKLEAARVHLGKTEKELQLRSEKNRSLSQELHEAGRQINALSFQIENLKLSHKQEVSSIKLKFKLSQDELENQKNNLEGQTEVFQMEVKLLKGEVTQLKAALMEKQEEMCRKVLLVHEEGSLKTAQLQKERLDLEKHISHLDAAAKAKLGEAKHREESMSIELRSLTAKLQQQSSQILELERYKGEMAELQQHNDRLDEQLRKALSREEEQRKSNKELLETLERVREELKTAQGQAEGVQQEAESLLQDSQELREANGNLQQKYAEAKGKLKRAAAAQKERKKITENREKRLWDKIELLEAKLEEQKLEVSLVKKNLSSFEQKYERKLNNLLQAKREFEHLLFWGPGSDSSYATPFVTGFEGISQSST